MVLESDGSTKQTILAGSAFNYRDLTGNAMAENFISTYGANNINGNEGNDFIEDHNGNSLLIGGRGSDTLVSRGGRDALWGGN